MTATLALLVLAQQAAAIDIQAIAAASPRPDICVARSAGPASNSGIWLQARSPEQQRFCSALARGYASLAHTPQRSTEAARLAEAAWPRHAAPLVLLARAEVALGRHAEAHEHFEQALQLDAGCLGAPTALHDRARAAVAMGKLDLATDVYRRLVPQVGLMTSSVEPWNVLIEAAVLAMHGGPPGLDEALGYLSEARRQAHVAAIQGFLLGSLALALDRQGRVQEAYGVVMEAKGPFALARHIPSANGALLSTRNLPSLPHAEALAVVAILAEVEAPAVAAEYWRASLDVMGPEAVWRDHAEGHLASVNRGTAGRRRR